MSIYFVCILCSFCSFCSLWQHHFIDSNSCAWKCIWRIKVILILSSEEFLWIQGRMILKYSTSTMVRILGQSPKGCWLEYPRRKGEKSVDVSLSKAQNPKRLKCKCNGYAKRQFPVHLWNGGNGMFFSCKHNPQPSSLHSILDLRKNIHFTKQSCLYKATYSALNGYRLGETDWGSSPLSK